jgi:hypothetical protein
VVGVRKSGLTNRSSQTAHKGNGAVSKFPSRITSSQEVTDDQLRSYFVFSNKEEG